MPEFQRRLAQRVQTLRSTRGLTQEEMETFGLHWKTVQKVEYGITDPKVSTLIKLANAFGMTVPELLRFPATATATRSRPPRRRPSRTR